MIEDRIKKWLITVYISGLVLIGFILIVEVIKASGVTINTGDILVFVGALIAAGATISAVKMTIKNQYNREFINSYPKKRKNADVVILEVIKTWQSAKRNYFGTLDLKKIEEVLSKFESQDDELLEKSTEVSDEFYILVREFIDTAFKYKYFIRYGEEIKLYGDHEHFQMKIETLCNDILNAKNKLDEEYRRIKKNYT